MRSGATITRSYPSLAGLAARRAFLLFCLAPHEVCRAPFLAVGAVGSYPAVSPLPFVARESAEGRFVFCDTVCDRGLHRSPHAFTWHAALWCPDFPLASCLAAKHQRSLRPTHRQSRGTKCNVQPQFPAAAWNSFKSVCPSVYGMSLIFRASPCGASMKVRRNF